jgi:prepilin-type N-terminal cleavage/methylation domain-containing protein
MKLQRSKQQGGFTLVEIVLAMGILLVGAAAILSMLTFGASLTRAAQLRTRAASAVEAVRADLEANMFPYVPSADGTPGEVGGPIELVDRAVPNLSQVVYSAKAKQNPELPREYRVDVDIRWTSGGVQREKQLTWLLLKEITFGERLRRRLVEKSGGSAGQSVK